MTRWVQNKSGILIPRREAGFIQPGIGLMNKKRGSGGGDPYWSNVVSLLHFDGTNGSQIFPDEVSGNTWTPSANAKLSTTAFKFGSASFYPTGGGWIKSQNSTLFGFGANDYTVEGWVIGGLTDDRCMFDNRSSVNQGIAVYSSTGGNHLAVANNSAVLATGVTALPSGVFVHYAISRKSGIIYGFIGGVLQFTVNDARVLASSTACYYGSNYLTSQQFAYNLDECRITNGIARYTANFTPPTAPFPNHS